MLVLTEVEQICSISNRYSVIGKVIFYYQQMRPPITITITITITGRI